MRATRAFAALLLIGSLAGCFVPGGGVVPPPVWDEATHGDSDLEVASVFPNPSTLVGSLDRNDAADVYVSTGPASGRVTVTCVFTSGNTDHEIILTSSPNRIEAECNGIPITTQLSATGQFGILLSSFSDIPVEYAIVVRAV